MSQNQDFGLFSKLPYDIRRQIWLYLVPDDNWKLEKHVECLRDMMSGNDNGSLARFKEEYPSPWIALAATPESRRIAFEIVKKKFDLLEHNLSSSRHTDTQSSALSINVRGSLVISLDDEFDGPQFFGQSLDEEVFWETKASPYRQFWDTGVEKSAEVWNAFTEDSPAEGYTWREKLKKRISSLTKR